jgi:serine/threonine protein kinase
MPWQHLVSGTSVRTNGGQPVTVARWRGEGSYARVYCAADGAGRPCALKVAKPEAPESTRRLHRERAALTPIDHPRVVRLLDHGMLAVSDGELPFLVLEWLEGDTLHELLRPRRGLPVRQALEILDAALEGLAQFHDRGTAHGDLRAQNLILVPRRGPVLTDPGVPSGQPESAPPRDLLELDVRAAGALLYRMLTGSEAMPPEARLSTARGLNPAVVELWEQTRTHPPTSAAGLRAAASRLRAAL